MKLPFLHKYYTVNVLIYLLFLNIILIMINPFSVLAFLFKIPLCELGKYCTALYYLNVWIIPFCIFCIFVEALLNKLNFIQTKLCVELTIIKKIFIYIFLTFALVFSGTLAMFCISSQVPYTPEELEQLRYD